MTKDELIKSIGSLNSRYGYIPTEYAASAIISKLLWYINEDQITECVNQVRDTFQMNKINII